MELFEITKKLLAAGIENAAIEARLLSAAFTGDALASAVARRVAHYPLQYILGEWHFYREVYEVGEDCLIPRSDTEILVDIAIKMLPNGARFLDLCTGSGCVAVSTLANRTDTAAVAVDLFPKTLELAKRNAQRNGVEARFSPLLANVLNPPAPPIAKQKFDAILSNPPYIKKSVLPTLQKEVTFEPAAALDGGEDGLCFYRAILQSWQTCLTPEGFILFEIGYDQGTDIAALADGAAFDCRIQKDFGGNERVAILTPKTRA